VHALTRRSGPSATPDERGTVIVLDASVVVEWLLRLPAADIIDVRVGDETLHAPHLLTVEVVQVVRRWTASGALGAERAIVALDDLVALGIVLHPYLDLVPTMWALRANLTAYDAAYVALATALDAPLLTLDRTLAAAPGLTARVELLG
jgi:predicted nucleic acid-binding protein